MNEQRVTRRHSATPVDRTAAAVRNIVQLMQKFHVFFAVRMFTAVFTRPQHGTYPEPDQSSHTLTY